MKTIGIFKSSCPSGWTRLSAWDDKFLMGAGSYGSTGGSDQHNHAMTMNTTTTGNAIGSFTVLEYFNHPKGCKVAHTHTITFNSVNTNTESVLPPYMDVVFCYKET